MFIKFNCFAEGNTESTEICLFQGMLKFTRQPMVAVRQNPAMRNLVWELLSTST